VTLRDPALAGFAHVTLDTSALQVAPQAADHISADRIPSRDTRQIDQDAVTSQRSQLVHDLLHGLNG